MASCEHGFEPSHRCGICAKARADAQFGKTYSGEVATTLKKVKRVQILMDSDDRAEKRG
jgi:hypothetical protein